MIDFIAILDSNTRIRFYDNTKVGNITENINYYNIFVENLTNSTSCNLIPIVYLQSGNRIDNEVEVLLPEDLAVSNLVIPDGFYRVTYSINQYYKVRYFIIYANIKTAFDELLEDTNYSVDITPLGKIKYVGDTTDGNIYQIRMISALIEQLKTYSSVSITSTTESSYLAIINDILTKLNRLLEI